MKQITGPSLAFLDGRFVNVPGDTMTGALVITPTADGIAILQVNQASGTDIFTVDTSTPLILGTRQLKIDGEVDEVQAIFQAHSSQTANIVEIQDSSANVLSGVDERGLLFSDGGGNVGNFFAGSNAGNAAASNSGSVALGVNSMPNITTGLGNLSIGSSSLFDLTTARFNVAVGSNALRNVISGFGNIGVGYFALYTTEGAYNIAIGYQAGRYQTGSNILVVGNQNYGDAATELTNSILYGVMAATPAAQTLRINANLITSEGRIKNTTRATTTYTILVTDDVIFANTDGAAWTATLPAGVEGQTFKIINSGSSANDLTVAPDGSEHLIGANSNFTLTDGETLVITYNATDGWY